MGEVARVAPPLESDGMIIGIETSVEHVGVAVGDHRGIRAHAMLASDRRHAESLTPIIEFVMEQAELSMTDLSAVAVDVGPGLFTGMRVGMSTAQSMAWALELPMVPVCSLDAVAMHADWSDDLVAAALDARRGEVYWATYRMRGMGAEPQRLTEPVVTPPEDMAVHLADRAEDVVCVGSGFHRHVEGFESAPWAKVMGVGASFPSAISVVRLASHRVAAEDTTTASRIEPIYLRAPDAEINWSTRGATP